MSRAYWVKLQSMVSETIKEGDTAVHRVKLDDILSEKEMDELLDAALSESEDWEKNEEGNYVATLEDGTELVWDTEANEVSATIEVEKEVSREVDVRGHSDEDYADHHERATQDARRALARAEEIARGKIRAEADQIRQEASKKLTENEQVRNEVINEVLQRTYAEAVKRKARRLGTVTSQTEGENAQGQYELTITISE